MIPSQGNRFCRWGVARLEQFTVARCGTSCSQEQPAVQNLFTGCPYYCVHKSHDQKVYCEGRLFHSTSLYRQVCPLGLIPIGHSVCLILWVAVPSGQGGNNRCGKQVQGLWIFHDACHSGIHWSWTSQWSLSCRPISVYPPSKQIRDFDIIGRKPFSLPYRLMVEVQFGWDCWME